MKKNKANVNSSVSSSIATTAKTSPTAATAATVNECKNKNENRHGRINKSMSPQSKKK